MKGTISPHALGLIVGAFLGLCHAAWAALVATDAAQGLLDWVFWIHFIENPYVVDIFDVSRAVVLVVFTSVVGYVVGWILGNLWNWARKK